MGGPARPGGDERTASGRPRHGRVPITPTGSAELPKATRRGPRVESRDLGRPKPGPGQARPDQTEPNSDARVMVAATSLVSESEINITAGTAQTRARRPVRPRDGATSLTVADSETPSCGRHPEPSLGNRLGPGPSPGPGSARRPRMGGSDQDGSRRAAALPQSEVASATRLAQAAASSRSEPVARIWPRYATATANRSKLASRPDLAPGRGLRRKEVKVEPTERYWGLKNDNKVE